MNDEQFEDAMGFLSGYSALTERLRARDTAQREALARVEAERDALLQVAAELDRKDDARQLERDTAQAQLAEAVGLMKRWQTMFDGGLKSGALSELWADSDAFLARHAQAAAHGDEYEIWSAAQLAPGEGIEDGAERIRALLCKPAAHGDDAVRKLVLPTPEQVMNVVMKFQWEDRKNGTGTTNWAANLGMTVVEYVARLNADAAGGPAVSLSDAEHWTEREVAEFLAIALRHVTVKGSLDPQDIRDAFRVMREQAAMRAQGDGHD